MEYPLMPEGIISPLFLLRKAQLLFQEWVELDFPSRKSYRGYGELTRNSAFYLDLIFVNMVVGGD